MSLQTRKMSGALETLLLQKAEQYERPEFIERDPIAVPHEYRIQQDVEIAGFFAATFAWGNRTSIINSSRRLMHLMDNAPFDFIKNHSENDRKKMLHFAHRTFNAADLLHFLHFLQEHFSNENSLESAFLKGSPNGTFAARICLDAFYDYFFQDEHLPRTHKHVAAPHKNSACKRLNMFLRWMVRSSAAGVDFGIWKKIDPADLICPLDVHTSNLGARFGLLPNNKANWNQAVLLTEQLKNIDAKDPCRFDFALFGLGAEERYK